MGLWRSPFRAETMSKRIAGMIAKCVSFGLAGVGLGGLAVRDVFHDYREDTSAALAGASFMLGFLLLSRWAPTRRTDDLLRAIGCAPGQRGPGGHAHPHLPGETALWLDVT